MELAASLIDLRFWRTAADNVVFTIVLMPVVGAVLAALSAPLGSAAVRRTALTNVLLTIALCGVMVTNYEPTRRNAETNERRTLQMQTGLPWLGRVALDAETGEPRVAGLDVRFAVGVDGVSLWLLVLTAVTALPAVILGPERGGVRDVGFYVVLLLLESCLFGVFAAQDVVLFVVFAETALVLTYALVAGWGGPERSATARRFLVYNLAGSGLILIGLGGMVIASAWLRALAYGQPAELVFDVERLTQDFAYLPTRMAEEYWLSVSTCLFACLLVGSLIRSAAVPFHTWLQPTNQESSAATAVFVTAVGVKVGVYGLLRFVLPAFPDYCRLIRTPFVAAGVGAAVYTGLLTLAQGDMRKMASCASLQHVAIALVAAMSLTTAGLVGSVVLLVQNGLVLAVFLTVVALLERRHGTRDLEAFGGLSGTYPRFAVLFGFSVLAWAGVPGTGGFVATILSTAAVYRVSAVGACGLLLSGVLLAWAFVWLFQRVFFGRFREPVEHGVAARSGVFDAGASVRPRPDLTGREVGTLAPVLALLLCLGLWPAAFTHRIEPTVARLVERQPGLLDLTAEEPRQPDPQSRDSVREDPP